MKSSDHHPASGTIVRYILFLAFYIAVFSLAAFLAVSLVLEHVYRHLN